MVLSMNRVIGPFRASTVVRAAPEHASCSARLRVDIQFNGGPGRYGPVERNPKVRGSSGAIRDGRTPCRRQVASRNPALSVVGGQPVTRTRRQPRFMGRHGSKLILPASTKVHRGGGLVARTPGVLTMHATSRTTGDQATKRPSDRATERPTVGIRESRRGSRTRSVSY